MFDVLLFDGAEVFGFSWCEVAGLFILSILFGASVCVVGFFGTASVVGLRFLCFNLVVRAENGAVVVLGDGDNLYVIASRVRFRKVVGVRGTAGGEKERETDECTGKTCCAAPGSHAGHTSKSRTHWRVR